MASIGPITDNIIDTILGQLNSKKVKDKINKKVVTPILEHIVSKYSPYFVSVSTVLIAMVVILIVILVMTVIIYRNLPSSNILPQVYAMNK